MYSPELYSPESANLQLAYSSDTAPEDRLLLMKKIIGLTAIATMGIASSLLTGCANQGTPNNYAGSNTQQQQQQQNGSSSNSSTNSNSNNSSGSSATTSNNRGGTLESAEAAVAKALETVPGSRLYDLDWKGQSWEVKVYSGNVETDLLIDANTLNVLSTEVDDDSDFDDIAELNAATVELIDAAKAALNYRAGLIDEISLETIAGTPRWEVKVVTDASRAAEVVLVDINSGQVI